MMTKDEMESMVKAINDQATKDISAIKRVYNITNSLIDLDELPFHIKSKILEWHEKQNASEEKCCALNIIGKNHLGEFIDSCANSNDIEKFDLKKHQSIMDAVKDALSHNLKNNFIFDVIIKDIQRNGKNIRRNYIVNELKRQHKLGMIKLAKKGSSRSKDTYKVTELFKPISR